MNNRQMLDFPNNKDCLKTEISFCLSAMVMAFGGLLPDVMQRLGQAAVLDGVLRVLRVMGNASVLVISILNNYTRGFAFLPLSFLSLSFPGRCFSFSSGLISNGPAKRKQVVYFAVNDLFGNAGCGGRI